MSKTKLKKFKDEYLNGQVELVKAMIQEFENIKPSTSGEQALYLFLHSCIAHESGVLRNLQRVLKEVYSEEIELPESFKKYNKYGNLFYLDKAGALKDSGTDKTLKELAAEFDKNQKAKQE